MPDEARQEIPDTPRLTATRYNLTLRDVSAKFDEAGLSRDLRTLQRYCASGLLNSIKEMTTSGMQYFIDAESVERAIKQLAQMHILTDEARHGAASRSVSDFAAPAKEPNPVIDTPRPTAADLDTVASESSQIKSPTQSGVPRQSPAEMIVLSHRVVELEMENKFLKRENEILQAHIHSERDSKAVLHSLSTMLETLGQRLPKFLLNSDERGNRVHTSTSDDITNGAAH
jgi:hypothetical protein